MKITDSNYAETPFGASAGDAGTDEAKRRDTMDIKFITNGIEISETTEEHLSPVMAPLVITHTKRVTVAPGPGSYSDTMYATVRLYRNGQLLSFHDMPATFEYLNYWVGAANALYLLNNQA